jgi:hypothetical protein
MNRRNQTKIPDKIDVEDLEDFIQGLRTAFDSLDDSDPESAQGIQLQLAKAISLLRVKKIAKMEELPKIDLAEQSSRDDLKNFLLNKLEFMKIHLDSEDVPSSRKFDLVMKITKLREQISKL